jgi:hypothetical protein
MMGVQSRILFVVILGLLALVWIGEAPAQERPAVSDYVIEQFGEPPAVPDGPISDEMRTALLVMIDDGYLQSVWGPDQREALGLIWSKSGDPADGLGDQRFAALHLAALAAQRARRGGGGVARFGPGGRTALGRRDRSSDRLGHSRAAGLSVGEAQDLHEFPAGLGRDFRRGRDRLAARLLGRGA